MNKSTFRVVMLPIAQDDVDKARDGQVVETDYQLPPSVFVDVAIQPGKGAVLVVVLKDDPAVENKRLLIVRDDVPIKYSPGRYLGHLLNLFFFAVD